MSDDERPYTLCTKCDHFVDQNYVDGQTPPTGISPYIHLEDAEQEFDHAAEPGQTLTMAEWQLQRPDLFAEHPDGAIGPNSGYHSRRGKVDRNLSPEETGVYLCRHCGNRESFVGTDARGYGGDPDNTDDTELTQPFTVDEDGNVEYECFTGGECGSEIGSYTKITCGKCDKVVWRE